MRTKTPTGNSLLKIPLNQTHLQPLSCLIDLRKAPISLDAACCLSLAIRFLPGSARDDSVASAQGDLDDLRTAAEP
jgi:hypothetical protein